MYALSIEWLVSNLEPLNEQPDFSPLSSLPKVSWQVEEGRLQEQDKADPLVVLVILDICAIVQVCKGGDSRVGNLVSLFTNPARWD